MRSNMRTRISHNYVSVVHASNEPITHKLLLCRSRVYGQFAQEQYCTCIHIFCRSLFLSYSEIYFFSVLLLTGVIHIHVRCFITTTGSQICTHILIHTHLHTHTHTHTPTHTHTHTHTYNTHTHTHTHTFTYTGKHSHPTKSAVC